MPLIHTLLIANRGEVACRVIRAARAQGIRAVAVYSEADRNARHVRQADTAVHIGPAAATESYLNIPRLLEAAAQTGADAVHPGYGFLAESAAFAEAVEDAGLIFVGPTPQAIATMGDKAAAKDAMQAAGVPTIPGIDIGEGTDVAAEAEKIGFPVLLKAVAGGGGKGMRILHSAEDIAGAVAATARSAAAAFGDGRLMLEKYVPAGRHIEVQVLGDGDGRVVHLGERECSLQRRHQKVIEEAPAPNLPTDIRANICAAGVRAAEAINYRGAGTVEFLLGPDGHFYFLEMNTRLQVEHPVTEEVWGVDLVALQLRIAEGRGLPEELPNRPTGHAIEARLYAEDAANGFLPQTGDIPDFRVPERAGLRLEAGVEAGDAVTEHYDPMIAKLIQQGPDRPAALRGLARALDGLWLPGLVTNREFLRQLLRAPQVVDADLDTQFVEREFSFEPISPSPGEAAALLSALAFEWQSRWLAGQPYFRSLPTGWRLGESVPQWLELQADGTSDGTEPGDAQRLRWWPSAAPVSFRMGDAAWSSELLERGGEGRLRLRVDGRVVGAWVHIQANAAEAQLDGGAHRRWRLVPRFPLPGQTQRAGDYLAPMPGQVTAVHAAAGDAVAEGQPLLVLYSMKMEHTITAHAAGTLQEIAVRAGDQVAKGDLLLRMA